MPLSLQVNFLLSALKNRTIQQLNLAAASAFLAFLPAFFPAPFLALVPASGPLPVPSLVFLSAPLSSSASLAGVFAVLADTAVLSVEVVPVPAIEILAPHLAVLSSFLPAVEAALSVEIAVPPTRVFSPLVSVVFFPTEAAVLLAVVVFVPNLVFSPSAGGAAQSVV